MSPPAVLPNQDYTVGWICALPAELAAASAMLDETHGKPREQHPSDQNSYCLGRIAEHNIVIACLPAGGYGTTSAAVVAGQMLSSFPSIRFGLLVGIGGGVPSEETDIRLGDVVVSRPKGTSGGVVQYDFGKTVDNGDFTPTGSLNKPPRVLLAGLHNLDGKHRRQGNEISKFLSEMIRKYPHMEQSVSYPGIENDRLYEAGYKHEDENRTCASCDDSKVKKRTPRSRNVPVIHYGLIASGNQVMKDGITRDRLGKQLDVLCFEMEAAGLMDNFPCLVIRGVSDYADSHKNKRWQGYAAATAAAYAKELLYVVRGNNVVEMPTAPTATTPPPGSKAQVRPTDVNITNEFERKMAALIPIPEKGRSDVPRTRYSHSKIQEISQLLRDVSLDGWSRSAGIYTVLRTLRKQEDMTEFIKNGITDLWLPFFPESIPPGLAPSTFKRFLKAQTIVLTESPDLVTGKHCHLTQEDLDEGFPKQCEWKATLGSGGFGFVDKISISSAEPNPPVYALKRIRREKDFQKTQEAMKYLESELEVLKKIKHQHFVKYVGSYTDPSFVGLIMAPVADENLASFLRNVPNVARNERESQRRLLWSFFGCLANALAHLHFVFDIRHKDIKPQNILVRRNNILLTDFGMALDWSDTLVTTTRGEMRKTDKYCAPEAAAAYEPRNSKSDIWSLGCVFLEMMTILKGETMSTIEQFFRDNGSQSPFFRSNQEAICDWLTRLKRNGFPANEDSEFGNTPLEWIQKMLKQEVKLRPSSRELLDSILASRTNPDQGIKFYGICCNSGELGRGGVDSTVDTVSNQHEVTSTTTSFLATPTSTDANTTGDSEAIQLLLNNGFDLEQNDNGSSLRKLTWAARHGHRVVVEWLLSKGAPVKAKDKQGWTALLHAVKNKQVEVARLLLDHGADVNEKDGNGWRPLHSAAENGLKAMTLLLLEKGAQIEVKSKSGMTPLHKAIENGSLGVVRLLLERGADIHAKDTDVMTTLHIAAVRGHDAVVQLLLDNGADLEARDARGATALMWAAAGGQRAAAQRLLENRADINATDDRKTTALFWAAVNTKEDVVELLVEKGADIETANDHGWTALLRAADNGDATIVRLLLTRALIEKKSGDGRTALHMAAVNGHEEIARQLLEKGADVEAKDWNDWTPLHWAAERGNIKIVKLLLENGADVGAKDRDNWTPLRRAQKRGHSAVVEMLNKHIDLSA